MIKFISLTVLSIVLTACAQGGYNPLAQYGPHIVEGNATYVVVYDAIGLKDKQLNVATAHCAKFGKQPRYKSNQSNSLECSGTQLCALYDCEK